ncbi:cuticle protein 19-like [Ischnura elegans]|uniref:cuticle protein 19-like n=1 Tax=Ischnura elegans TaxID=197161 RepID=UPI001ED8BAB9|nr:cuticle protein 19-like [Ischnura elegans]
MIHQAFIFLAAIIATAFAFPGLPYGGLVHGGHAAADYYAYPRYDFNYGVADGHTGDLKNQWEVRDGGLTKGSYSLKEADRAIHRSYVTDSHHGYGQGHAAPVYNYGPYHGALNYF